MQINRQPACSAEPGDVTTGNVKPLLHEIRHALRRWLDHQESTTIDLRSIPMAPGEEDEIAEELGTGEIFVQMSALGPSEIVETRYPGVWRVTHYNSNREVIGKFIEVCDLPRLLKAADEDISDGLEQLEAQLV
ncbi:MAG: hydrogenase expression/formation protein [Gammaproteobacteria bacterium]|nr:MAG: hydrogenase expression/formation protein [Gammaproteobacteria bacterium]